VLNDFFVDGKEIKTGIKQAESKVDDVNRSSPLDPTALSSKS